MTFDDAVARVMQQLDVLLAEQRAEIRLLRWIEGHSDAEIAELMHGQRELDDARRAGALVEIRGLLSKAGASPDW